MVHGLEKFKEYFLKNDVFRILANVTPSTRVETSEAIQNDIDQFIKLISEDKPDITSLGIKDTNFDELMEILDNVYLRTSEAL